MSTIFSRLNRHRHSVDAARISACATWLFAVEFGLQLAPGGIFERSLDAFAALAARIACARGILPDTAAQHDGGLLIAGGAVEQCAEVGCCQFEFSLPPEFPADIEPV